jgi:hypothetical protein
MTKTERVKDVFRQLPNRKRYLEFITAFLTIPVLLTVIYSNVNSIRNANAKKPTEIETHVTPAPLPKQPQSTGLIIEVKNVASGPASLAQAPVVEKEIIKECKKEVGPVEIISPQEGQTVTDQNFCIDVSYHTGEYCAVVWSYRINDSAWSEYSDKSTCIYSMSPGAKQLEVRIKSITGGDEVLLKRSFSFQPPKTNPSPTILPTSTPVSTNSAQVTP